MNRFAARKHPSEPETRLARRARHLKGSPVDSSLSLLQAFGGDVISFGMGSAGPDAIPGTMLAALASEVFDDPSNAAFNYGPTEGEPLLREALIQSLRAAGEPVDEDTLLITSGAMQGLDLVCKLFLEPGDVVVTESPTYANALVSIASYEGRIIECPMDEQGIVVDAIPHLVTGAGPLKLIYVIPNHQNPTGFSLTPDRRLQLLALAREYGAIILEDDPYGGLGYDGVHRDSLFKLDEGGGSVIAVNTFSKVLAPGLRVGWVLAGAEVIRTMVAARQGMDTCTNVVAQRLVASFIQGGSLDDHVLWLRRRYSAKLQVFLGELERHFGSASGVEWSRPTGGFFLWLELPGIDADRFLAVAMKEGVFFIPGSAFTTTARFRDRLRLCFTYPTEDQIVTGVARLKAAYHRELRRLDRG